MYSGLARPADYSIFLHGNGLACLLTSPCWHENGLALWHGTVIMMTDNGTDKIEDNVPVICYALQRRH